MQDLYVMFCAAPHWLYPILKEGYGHVRILAKNDGDWYWVDPLHSHLAIEKIYFDDNEANALDIARSVDRYSSVFHIKLTAKRSESFKLRVFNLLTCVSVVKYALGITKFRVQTPWQLAKHLRKLIDNKKVDGVIDSIEEI